MPENFLFGQPNRVQYLSRRFLMFGCAIVVCGITSVFNGAIASALEAEKTYHMDHFVNTHWITTVFLFSGFSVVLMEKFRLNFYLFLSTGFTLVSIPIGFGAFIGDCVNLYALNHLEDPTYPGGYKWSFLQNIQITAIQIYSAVDLVCCFFATVFAVLILREIRTMSSRYFGRVPEYQSMALLFTGFLLILVSKIKIILWAMEYHWIRELGNKAKFLFLHYTIDEPVWQAIYITTGILNLVVYFRGTRILMYCSMGLTALSTYPALLYLWIDYRWYSNVKITEMTANIPKQNEILEANLAIGCVHLLIIIANLCVQIKLMQKSGNAIYDFQLNTEHALRRAISISGLLLMAAGVAFMISDLANLFAKTFYRVFYPTEQKLPFVLFIAGIFCLICLRKRFALYFIPATFLLLLQAGHTTLFHISAYIYLSHNLYFDQSICDLFFWGQRTCNHSLEQLGAVSHFFEALMALTVLILIVYVATILTRIMKLHQLQMGALGLEEIRRKKGCELWLTILGILSLIFGLIVFGLSIMVRRIKGIYNNHPLLVLHSMIYRTCLSIALIIYPSVQIFFARNITYYPLRSITLIYISLFRFVEIITQLDYRNVGQDTGIAWTSFSLVEILSLGVNFVILCLCASLLDLGLNRMPHFDFVEPSEANGTPNPRVAAINELKSMDNEARNNNLMAENGLS